MWLAATLGEIATFRLRRPLLASLLPIGLFTFLLIVGTGAGAQFYVAVFIAALLTYWGVESAHRLRSWGRWMSTWSHLKADAPTSIAGGIARKMGASCVAAAIVAPLFLPVLGHGGISWRNGIGDGPGGGQGAGVGGNVDLLASITPERIRQTTATLFTVNAAEESYWRLASLSRFDGKTWYPASADFLELDDGAVPTTLGPPEVSKRLQQRFNIQELEGTHLPAAALPVRVEYERSTNVRVDPESGDLLMNPAISAGMSYEVTSRVSHASFEQLKKADTGSPGTNYEVEPELSDAVTELRDEWTQGADTPFEKLIAIQEHLRTDYDYDLDVQPGTSTDYLSDFLLNTRRGYCQQFATAFAVLARSLGYPTRVSIGFLPGQQDVNEPTHFIVRGTDTHAWPEVFFYDYGWIRFEPTPRDIAPAPAYTSETRSGPLPSQGGPGGGGGGQPPGHKFADGGFVDPFLRGEGADDPATPDAPRDTSPAWRPAFSRLLLVVLGLMLLWLVTVPVLKALRVRNRYRRATTPRDVVAAAFAEFQSEAAELADRKHPAESGAAYTDRIASLGVVPRSAAARLGRLHDAAEYSTRDIPVEHADEARRLVTQMRASMWRAAGIAGRATRLFSAKELLASRSGTRLARRLRPAAATGLTSRV
jgi:transglutaminase-like putative cysteine protease